ncbi:MAG: Spy/CpxP family protein refolding chaperone [Kastovskya adunca ATA6-11-RM4]|nr:Spy/CpxP family protein refolding chaperone [Kastovskya adunca ATA6-11-RM4]
MMLRRVSVLGLALLSLGGVVAIVNPNPLTAEITQKSGRNPLGERSDRLMQQLNLTSEQQQQLQAIRERDQGQMRQQRQALHQEKQQLMQLMAGNATEAEIRTQHNQVKALQQQLGDARFESMLAMRNVLTPEQRSRFAQLMQQRRENRQTRMPNAQGQRRS